jgi:hypothetical protein
MEVQCRLVHRNHVIWRTKITKFWRNGNDSKQRFIWHLNLINVCAIQSRNLANHSNNLYPICRDKYFFKIKFVFFLYLRLSASSKENDLPLCIYFWYQTDSGVLIMSILTTFRLFLVLTSEQIGRWLPVFTLLLWQRQHIIVVDAVDYIHHLNPYRMDHQIQL